MMKKAKMVQGTKVMLVGAGVAFCGILVLESGHSSRTLVAVSNQAVGSGELAANSVQLSNYEGPITVSINRDGVNLVPPPSGVQPAFSWEKAAALCAGQSTGTFWCGDVNVAPQITLATATSDNEVTHNPDGTITREFDHRLVYAMTWPSVPCLQAGPVGATHSPTTCTFVTWVDANTGQDLGASQTSNTGQDPGAGPTLNPAK